MMMRSKKLRPAGLYSGQDSRESFLGEMGLEIGPVGQVGFV